MASYRSDDARCLISNSGILMFESMSSASPIRFNPDTPDYPPALRLGSQSSLSSSMTPEATTAIMKATIIPAIEPSVPARSNVQNSISTMSHDMPLSVTAVNGLKLTLSGSTYRQDSVIEVSQSSPSQAPYQAASDSKRTGKLTTQYVMPDGSVITGKGLGRGRPGVKRGPRKSRNLEDDSIESTPSATTNAAESSSTSMAGKRKRADSESSNIRVRSITSSSLSSRESSVEYNPTATQTRSGRQTQRPISITASTATPSATASPAAKKVATPNNVTPALKSHPKIKRKIYRGKEQFALCEHCLRGFGPPDNVIVFCDACNKCWHQNCHQPQISKEIVTDAKAEWFCATCDKILHGNKKMKKPLIPSPAKPIAHQPPPPPPIPPVQPPEQKFGPPLVGAIALTIDQRKKYLETLSRDQLVSLLLRAGELAPQMPIFETPIPFPRPERPSFQPQFTSDYVTPVTEVPGRTGTNKADLNDVPDEGYDDSYDEHAALYPKVGEGVKLPPEHEDLKILLEGPASRTFSHWVKGQPVKTTVDTIPLHLSQRDYDR